MKNAIHLRHIGSKLSVLFALTSVLVVLTLQLGAAAISLWQAPTNAQIAENLVLELDGIRENIKAAFAESVIAKDNQEPLFSELAAVIYSGEMNLNYEFEDDFSYNSYVSTLQTLAFYNNQGQLLDEFLCPQCDIENLDEYPLSNSRINSSNDTLIESMSKPIATPLLLSEITLRIIEDDRDQTIWLHYPVKSDDESKIVGHVLVQVFVPRIESFMLPMLMEMYFRDLPEILFFSLLVGAIIGSIASRGILKRILHISQITRRWAQGNLTDRIEDKNHDELNIMATDMNTMAQDLSHWLSDRELMVMQEERSRVARDLHDTVKQKMFALQMQLSSAKQVTKEESTKQFIEQSLQLVRDSQQDLKSIIYALRPISLEQKGLVQAMQDYIQQWRARTGINVVVALDDVASLSSKLEDTLYNIFQELMANIERHAEAKNVSISLVSENNNIVLKIEDDGIGFEHNVERKEGVDQSTGLQNIRDRINEQHGQFNIVNRPSLGTLAQVNIQINSVSEES